MRLPGTSPVALRRAAFAFSATLLFGLVALGTISATAAPSPAPSASGSGAAAGNLPGDPAKGQQIYNASGCTACHGASLSGGVGPKLNPMAEVQGAPKFDQAAFKAVNPDIVNYLLTTITNGKAPSDGFGAMPALGGAKLSDQDVKDLAAYLIQVNQSGKVGLGPEELARSNVFWVTVGIVAMLLFTYLLARYNMRWIGRRAAARQEQERRP